MLDFNVSKISVALICSSILLTGCLQNQNGDIEPPQRDEPIEEPSDDSPEPDTPDLEDPDFEDPDLGDPDLGDPGNDNPDGGNPDEDPRVDGEQSTPYASGIQLYGLRDSDIGSPNVIRSARNISGNTIDYDFGKRTSDNGNWNDFEGLLPAYVLSSESSDFLDISTGPFGLNTSSYALLFPESQSVLFEIQHIFYDAAGQGVRDFVSVNMNLDTLAQFINDSDSFDASAYIYEEVLTNPTEMISYFPGRNNGVNCNLSNGGVTSVSLSESGNCNIVVNDSFNAVTDLENAVGSDLGSAQSLRMSALLEDGIKLVARDVVGGNIHDASDPDSENNIGYYQIEQVSGIDYLSLTINDLENQDYFVSQDLPWEGILKLVLIENDGYVRIGGVIPSQSSFSSETYLLNDAALDRLSESVNW